MKPQELKQEYIKLRIEGKSYSFISEQLHISKSTCAKWEQNLFAEIDELKRAKLEELYESYSMTKQACIKKLGDTLEKINEALAKADFSTVDPTKLLDFKLKYPSLVYTHLEKELLKIINAIFSSKVILTGPS